MEKNEHNKYSLIFIMLWASALFIVSIFIYFEQDKRLDDIERHLLADHKIVDVFLCAPFSDYSYEQLDDANLDRYDMDAIYINLDKALVCVKFKED
jgi:hypothetical protein